MMLKYDRIARASTPSLMTFQFSSQAIHNGHIRLYLSDSVVKPLGAMRIAPEPARSSIGDGGLTYDFPATGGQAMVQVELEPQLPGAYHFTAHSDGEPPIEGSVVVMP